MPAPTQQQAPSRRFSRTYRKFQTMRTDKDRTALADGEYSLLENLIPKGDGNLTMVRDISAVLATIPGGVTVIKFFGVNMTYNNLPMPVILSFTIDGAMWAYHVTLKVLWQAASPGTFIDPRDVDIWEGGTVLIIDNIAGYFYWIPTQSAQLVPSAGASQPITGKTISVYAGRAWIGNGRTIQYTAPPNAATNIPLTQTIQIGNEQITYTGSTGTTFTGCTRGVNGTTAVAHADEAVVSQSGGVSTKLNGGIFATDTTITVDDTTGFLANSSGSGAAAGTPGYADFTSADGAGSVVITDTSFEGVITKLYASLDVLWIFSEVSVNQISNVQIVSGVTIFSNTNISSTYGSPYKDTVQSISRAILFANQQGAYGQIGVSSDKISDFMDEVFKNIDFTQVVMGSPCTIENNLLYLIHCTYKDPNSGSERLVMLSFFKGQWFLLSQSIFENINLAQIAHVEVNGNWNVYITDGQNIYQCFAGNLSFAQMSTPLRSFEEIIGGDCDVTQKQWDRMQLVVNAPLAATFKVQPRNEFGVAGVPLQQFSPQKQLGITWLNGAGGVIQWQNNAGQNITFTVSSYSTLRYNVNGIFGEFVGFDLEIFNSNHLNPFIKINSYSMDVTARDVWSGQ